MYDLILDTIGIIIKNGWSLSTAAGLTILFFRQRRMRNKLRQFLPFLFQEDSEVKQYIQNQHSIMENQRRIMEHMGVMPWSADSKVSKLSATKRTTLFARLVHFFARSAQGKTEYGRTTISGRMRRMKLDKVWIGGLIGYVAYFIKQFTGFEVPDEMIDKSAELVLLVVMIIAMIRNMTKSKEAKPVEHKESYGDHGPTIHG
jgi:hypothetical protein